MLSHLLSERNLGLPFGLFLMSLSFTDLVSNLFCVHCTITNAGLQTL
jgi:hypothetical protein